LTQNAADDGGHEAGLGRGGLLAADAGDPLDFNLAGRGRVEVLAVGQLRRAQGVQDHVFALVVDGGGFVGADDRKLLLEAGRIVLTLTPGWGAERLQGCGARGTPAGPGS